MGKFQSLPSDKQRAILLLTRQIVDPNAPKMTLEEVARECQISVITLFRWRQDPAFIAARKEIVSRYSDELVIDAFRALKAQLQRKDSIRAAEIVLKSRGMLVDRREGGPDTIVNVEISDKDNGQLAQDLAELRARVEKGGNERINSSDS